MRTGQHVRGQVAGGGGVDVAVRKGQQLLAGQRRRQPVQPLLSLHRGRGDGGRVGRVRQRLAGAGRRRRRLRRSGRRGRSGLLAVLGGHLRGRHPRRVAGDQRAHRRDHRRVHQPGHRTRTGLDAHLEDGAQPAAGGQVDGPALGLVDATVRGVLDALAQLQHQGGGEGRLPVVDERDEGAGPAVGQGVATRGILTERVDAQPVHALGGGRGSDAAPAACTPAPRRERAGRCGRTPRRSAPRSPGRAGPGRPRRARRPRSSPASRR